MMSQALANRHSASLRRHAPRYRPGRAPRVFAAWMRSPGNSRPAKPHRPCQARCVRALRGGRSSAADSGAGLVPAMRARRHDAWVHGAEHGRRSRRRGWRRTAARRRRWHAATRWRRRGWAARGGLIAPDDDRRSIVPQAQTRSPPVTVAPGCIAAATPAIPVIRTATVIRLWLVRTGLVRYRGAARHAQRQYRQRRRHTYFMEDFRLHRIHKRTCLEMSLLCDAGGNRT